MAKPSKAVTPAESSRERELRGPCRIFSTRWGCPLSRRRPRLALPRHGRAKDLGVRARIPRRTCRDDVQGPGATPLTHRGISEPARRSHHPYTVLIIASARRKVHIGRADIWRGTNPRFRIATARPQLGFSGKSCAGLGRQNSYNLAARKVFCKIRGSRFRAHTLSDALHWGFIG